MKKQILLVIVFLCSCRGLILAGNQPSSNPDKLVLTAVEKKIKIFRLTATSQAVSYEVSSATIDYALAVRFFYLSLNDAKYEIERGRPYNILVLNGLCAHSKVLPEIRALYAKNNNRMRR